MNATKVAVVGAGVAGLAAAHRLQDGADVTLFEASGRLGGHTDTHGILVDDRRYAVDSGFIVFNERNYPRFSAWLAELGVASQPSDMSFGVRNVATGLEYGSAGLSGLFARRRNLVSPRFHGMLKGLRRFYREAVRDVLEGVSRTETLGQYLERRGYSQGFVWDHIVPMCAALWSQPNVAALSIPVHHVVAFMEHHRMLQLHDRPEWRVIRGGSRTYVDRFAEVFEGRIAAHEPVTAIRRLPAGVEVTTGRGTGRFDAVVLACHSDQALALLADPSAAEKEILGAMRYGKNTAVVHSDASVMPRRRAAWSSWNALVAEADADRCTVTYWMNRLQSIPGPRQFFVTLNPKRDLEDVWAVRHYEHPVFTLESRAAAARHHEINGVGATYFCGAYWGWGFHEDGFCSGERAAVALQAEVRRAA